MPQAELMTILSETASRTVVLKAINDAVEKGDIIREPMPGRGNPMLLKIAENS